MSTALAPSRAAPFAAPAGFVRTFSGFKVLLPFAALIALWWTIKIAAGISDEVLVSPATAFAAFVRLVDTGVLAEYAGTSLRMIGACAVFSLAVGVPIGFAVGVNRYAARSCEGFLRFLQGVSGIAWLPLVIIWLGLGFEAKVFLTWLVAVFPVIINAQIGVANVSPAFIETARAFGCNQWQIFRRVILHAAVPFFIAGIRLGLGRALVGVVVAEMFTALAGLGYMVVFYGNTFRTAELFVPIVVLAVLSIAITNLIYRLERWMAPWRRVEE